MLNDEHRQKIARRLEAIRHDPQLLRRYDVNGDGVIDTDEWLAVERAITLEVQTEIERARKADEDRPASVDALEILGERYEVLGLLGEGAQGRTHRGRDRRTGGLVAIKELSIGQLDDWKAIELFEREGKVLKNLDHPGIPAYVDAFHLTSPDAQERFFLVQEFVDGEDFEALVDQGLSMTEEEAKQFLRRVLEILVYLQERSPPVIHRDIKPSNIMRRRDGSLVLIDFGAVQSVIPDGRGGSTIIGTSGYMPIEQLYGRATAATDLYALGATVVHLLSARHPADLPLREMRLGFEPYINVSSRLERFLQRLLDPIVERRIGTAKEALSTLDNLDRLSAAGHEQAEDNGGAMMDLLIGLATEDHGFVDRLNESLDEKGSLSRSEVEKLATSRKGRVNPVPTQSRPTQSRPTKTREVTPVAPTNIPQPNKGVWQWVCNINPGLLIGLMAGVGFLGFTALLIGFVYWVAPGNDEERCRPGIHVDTPESCMRWGQELEAARDLSLAQFAYQRGCSNGQEDHGPACARGALLLFETRQSGAEDLALKACDMGEGLGCAIYAQLRLRRYVDGPREVDDDLHEMKRYGDMACNMRSARGCAQLAVAEALLGDEEAAGRAARRSRELDERNPYASLSLGLLEGYGGKVDEAKKLIESAAKGAQVATGIEAPLGTESFEQTIELYVNAFDLKLPSSSN